MANNTNPGYLRKYCDCPEARVSKCKHPWTFVVRDEERGDKDGKMYVSLRKYLKRIAGDAAKLATLGDARKLETKGDAEAVVLLIRGELSLGIDPRVPLAAPATAATAKSEAAGLTVAEVADRVMLTRDESQPSYKSERQYLNRINAITIPGVAEAFGAWPIASVTEDHILRVWRVVTAGRSNSSKRKYRRSLRRIFVKALKLGAIAENPFPANEAIKAGVCTMRNERIEPAYEKRLVAASLKLPGTRGTLLADLIVAAIECGARKGELLAIQIRDVRLDDGVLVIAARERGGSKKGIGNGRVLPISRKLGEILERRLTLDGKELPANAYVFGDAGARVASVQRVWEMALLVADGATITYAADGKNLSADMRERLAVINRNFHDLRHEAALRWHKGIGLKNPIPLNAIGKLLGHEDLAQLRIYLGIKEDDAIEAFRAAAGIPKFRAIKGGKAGAK